LANILDDLTYNQKVLGIGGATVGGLGIGKALEYSHDINKINQWSNMGYGKGNPVPTKLSDTLKGSWVPNKTFEKMGLGPGSTKNWFFNTISDKHFKPVQNTMQFAKNIPGYAMKGLGYLASLPAQAALMTLHSTPANADEVEWEKQLMKKYQLQNKKKQQLQDFKNIEAKTAAEAAAKAKADAAAKANAAAASQRREGKGGTHMSRSRDQGGLGISQSQAQSISDANRAAGMSGWGLADGGLAQHAPRYANGGLIDFFRYGGFIG